MKRSKAILLTIGALLLMFVSVVALFVFAPDRILYFREIRKGDRLVSAIEAYRRQNGRLPESTTKLVGRFSDDGQFYYEKCSDSDYVVWFGTTLGESMTYSSDTRLWEDFVVSCPSVRR